MISVIKHSSTTASNNSSIFSVEFLRSSHPAIGLHRKSLVNTWKLFNCLISSVWRRRGLNTWMFKESTALRSRVFPKRHWACYKDSLMHGRYWTMLDGCFISFYWLNIISKLANLNVCEHFGSTLFNSCHHWRSDLDRPNQTLGFLSKTKNRVLFLTLNELKDLLKVLQSFFLRRWGLLKLFLDRALQLLNNN